ncbi:MAG: tRNA threonylcarbamoyladenosine dehydratase [Clostridia bacterium]|nr:tRNA threonylcarbamoyladenosine dehydratase [Clostridia bacterium]
MPDAFDRTRLVLGAEALTKLKNARVAVFGLGGVGGAAVEALARSGVGSLELIDSDTVAVTNLNRQLIATHTTLGMKKTEAAKARVLDINPDCRVTARDEFFLPENADAWDFTAYDYVIDAVDTVAAKLCLAERCAAAGTPIISCMGTGNKTDPTRLEIADIYRTSVCPLAKVMRRECRKRGIKRLKVLYSREEPVSPKTDEVAEKEETGRRSTPGSTAFVPPAAGFIIAAEAVKDMITR